MRHVWCVCVACVLCVMCSVGGPVVCASCVFCVCRVCPVCDVFWGGGCCVHVMCVLCVLRVCACDVCGLSCVSERQRCAQLSESCCAYGPRPAYCTP